jgi:hypothetical protein
MMQPVMARRPDGTLSLLFLPPEFSALLLEIPALLDDDDRPEVQSRRYQVPTADDEEANAEWARMMHPDLFHLVAEARDVVARDLQLLEQTHADPTGGQLNIPTDHRNAWISAIQTVRVSLGAAHSIDAEDMEDLTILSERGERSRAIMRIHVLGDLQGLLIQEVDPSITERGPDWEPDADDEEADD